MPSLKQYQSLDQDLKIRLMERVIERKKRFLAVTGKRGSFDPKDAQILIVGDRPAPSAPDDATFHYTPFGALWNSSLYINMHLEQNAIEEHRLTWINAADFHGVPMSYDILKYPWKKIIALGGAAKRWLDKAPNHSIETAWVPHPSYWKRFHSKDEYQLANVL